MATLATLVLSAALFIGSCGVLAVNVTVCKRVANAGDLLRRIELLETQIAALRAENIVLSARLSRYRAVLIKYGLIDEADDEAKS